MIYFLSHEHTFMKWADSCSLTPTCLPSVSQVALVFPNNDPVAFMVAFYGCLLAEVVPVPIEVPLSRKVLDEMFFTLTKSHPVTWLCCTTNQTLWSLSIGAALQSLSFSVTHRISFSTGGQVIRFLQRCCVMLILSASATSVFYSYPGAPDSCCVSFQFCLCGHLSDTAHCWNNVLGLSCLLATSISEKIILSEQQAQKHVRNKFDKQETSPPAALPSHTETLSSVRLQLLILLPSPPGTDMSEGWKAQLWQNLSEKQNACFLTAKCITLRNLSCFCSLCSLSETQLLVSAGLSAQGRHGYTVMTAAAGKMPFFAAHLPPLLNPPSPILHLCCRIFHKISSFS